jgi:hypothetical protein
VIRCPRCKKFLSKIRYALNGLEELVWVRGNCKKHGRVDAEYECYEEVLGLEPI